MDLKSEIEISCKSESKKQEIAWVGEAKKMKDCMAAGRSSLNDLHFVGLRGQGPLGPLQLEE